VAESEAARDAILEIVRRVKALGVETCMTLGMLDRNQSDRLAKAGLDYYNHNIDTSERYYPSVTSTRSFSDRLETLENVRQSGMKVCCGGILGMGENENDRVDMLVTLANLAEPPESVPITCSFRSPARRLLSRSGSNLSISSVSSRWHAS
jgi:biotin synthase